MCASAREQEEHEEGDEALIIPSKPHHLSNMVAMHANANPYRSDCVTQTPPPLMLRSFGSPT